MLHPLAEPGLSELRVRGPNVGMGYWVRGALQPLRWTRAWFGTGDLSVPRAGGYVLQGRRDEVFKLDNGRMFTRPVRAALSGPAAARGVRGDRVQPLVRGELPEGLSPARTPSSSQADARELLERLHDPHRKDFRDGALNDCCRKHDRSRLRRPRRLTPSDVESAALPLRVTLGETARAEVVRCEVFVTSRWRQPRQSMESPPASGPTWPTRAARARWTMGRAARSPAGGPG